MLRTSKVISGVALVALLLCVGRLAVQAQNVLLPATTPAYYTIVTAGFGSFSFSLHYEEYGNSATEFTLSVGRYYSPTAVEYTDEINNRYYIEYLGQYQQCSSFYLDSVGGMRVMGGATEFLVELNQANVMFQNLGMTNAVRSQPSVHFNTALAWTSSTIAPMYVEVDEFLREAYATAGLPVSSNYAVSVSIDVYFASDTFGGILLAGAGSIPLRYSINGSFVDNVYGSKPINIVYDFMQFAALDYYTAAYALYVPWECSYTTPVNTSYPASIPTPPSTLPAPNTTLPTWTSGRAAFELTASNNPVMQIDALLKSAHGEELLIFLSNPSEYTFYSMLYLYDFADERDFNFAAGAVYTLNGTDANPYNEWNFDFTYRTCTGTTINPNTVSPIQWLNAASINRLYADPNFLRGAKPLGRVILADRAITTDAWQVVKTVAFNGAVYNFTLQLYLTTNGWLNLGRTTAPQAAQLIRLSYSGVKYPAKGLATIYSMQIDWYLQYIQAWNQYSDTWMPSNYGCTEVVTGLPVLPPMPPQYSVSVSEAWFDSSSSSQYTVYADTVKNVRRLDGRFTAPGGMAIVTPSPISPNYVSVVQWSQNVTLTQGFSGQMLSQAMPYLTYNSNQAPVCGAVTLSAFDFNGAETLNFFDWLGQADPSQALYIETKNIRGVDLDIYQVSITSENSGHFVVSTFQVYYLSIDETMTLTVPVMAEVSVQFYNFYWFGAPTAEYQFYNFRQSVPSGIFTSPTALSCTGIPALPVPVYTPPYYEDPSPQGDGTPTTAPTWPGVFSMLIEGQFFANNQDYNIYVARWYVDFNNFRERLDIEPAFSIAPVNGVNPISATYLYYYNNNGGTFAFNSGTLVTYNGSCSQTPITTANMNPLKRVPPGNLFDTFFPQTTAKMSQQSTYNSYSRYDWSRWDGVFYDEYDWNANTTFQGYKYSLTSSILISIPEWMNSAETGIYNFTRIPLAIQANGNILSLANKVVNQYSAVFRTAFYQPIQPGFAMFDAALLGCPTSQQSPWWNIYGDQRNGVPQSSSDSVSSSTIIGAVVGVVGGIFVVAMVATFVRRWKRGDTIFSKYPGGTKSNGNTHANDNELVGVGKVASDEAPENSLNRASLNNLVKEGNPLEVEVEVHDTNTDTAAPSKTNSSDH